MPFLDPFAAEQNLLAVIACNGPTDKQPDTAAGAALIHWFFTLDSLAAADVTLKTAQMRCLLT